MSAKILVADDDQTSLKLLESSLTAEGYEVKAVTDGMAALNSVKESTPDLIFLDVMMPKMDGFQACRMIKFDEKTRDIPIIMLTSRNDQTDIDTGQEVGADVYLTKPFDTQQMLEEVKKQLSSA